jgi:hypothetical protein
VLAARRAGEKLPVADHSSNSLPTRWANTTIIVNDSVRVDSPYSVDDARAAKDNKPAEIQIKKVLEGYYNKKKLQQPAASQPAATPRPVIPALPRKGG